METIIRPADMNDAVQIADLLRSIGGLSWIASQTPETIQERIQQHLALCLRDESHSVFVAAEQGEQVTGYVSVHWNPYLIHGGPEGYVSELFVRESARGQGLGARLLDTVHAEAKSRGCARLLLLNIRQRESYQRGFYRKNGWIEWEDAAVFVYKL